MEYPCAQVISDGEQNNNSPEINISAMNTKTLRYLAALLVAAPALQAQGTVIFANRLSMPSVVAPIFYPDGVTFARAGTVYAELLARPEADSLAPVGEPVLLGPHDGFFDGGIVSIPSVAPGQMAWLQVRAWDARAEGFEEAKTKGLLWGESNLFALVTGGPPNPNGVPLPLPPALVGLEAITLVPEPSPKTLLILGGGLWLLAARWRRADGHDR